MASSYLEAEHHAIRYVPWARLRRDEDENVIGVLGVAFRLRTDEDYLSATWLEYFEGARTDRIQAAVRNVRASKLDVRPKSGFAVGNVGRVKAACLADQRQHKIRVIHEPENDNEAHVAFRQWPRDNDLLLELIAEDVWNDVVLNVSVPAS